MEIKLWWEQLVHLPIDGGPPSSPASYVIFSSPRSESTPISRRVVSNEATRFPSTALSQVTVTSATVRGKSSLANAADSAAAAAVDVVTLRRIIAAV